MSDSDSDDCSINTTSGTDEFSGSECDYEEETENQAVSILTFQLTFL